MKIAHHRRSLLGDEQFRHKGILEVSGGKKLN